MTTKLQVPRFKRIGEPVGDDPYRIFALTVIRQASDDIESYMCGRRGRGIARCGARAKAETLAAAAMAYKWLTGQSQGRLGLSFEFICSALGYDAETFREQIFARWNVRSDRFRRIVIS